MRGWFRGRGVYDAAKAGEFSIAADKAWNLKNVRVAAFVQESETLKVPQAAQAPVAK